VDERTLEWLDILGRGLLWGAVAVISLAVIGAIAIASTDTAVFLGAEDLQREGRGIAAIGAFGAGVTAAGVLAGLGALLRIKVAELRERGRE
jgi:hypothetical protein